MNCSVLFACQSNQTWYSSDIHSNVTPRRMIALCLTPTFGAKVGDFVWGRHLILRTPESYCGQVQWMDWPKEIRKADVRQPSTLRSTWRIKSVETNLTFEMEIIPAACTPFLLFRLGSSLFTQRRNRSWPYLNTHTILIDALAMNTDGTNKIMLELAIFPLLLVLHLYLFRSHKQSFDGTGGVANCSHGMSPMIWCTWLLASCANEDIRSMGRQGEGRRTEAINKTD